MIGSTFGTFGDLRFQWNFDYGPLQGVKNRIEILKFDDFPGGGERHIQNSAFEKSPAELPGRPRKRSHRPRDGARETRARFPDDARWQRQTPSNNEYSEYIVPLRLLNGNFTAFVYGNIYGVLFCQFYCRFYCQCYGHFKGNLR